MRVLLLFAAACAWLGASLFAHGGQYRGPWPGLPGVPGGGPTGPGSPTTGGRPTASETTSWQVWWEFNKEPFLLQRRLGSKLPETGSDDYYLGPRRRSGRVDALAPTEADLVDRVVPTLARMLADERNRDTTTASLVALGKIGKDGSGVALEKDLAAHVLRDDQEVRETAVLALGIAGRPQALATLQSLVRDDSAGRRLEGRERVSDRTRAFAAYSLGVLAFRSDDPELKQTVHDTLWPLLQDRELKDRDLRVAAVTGLGLLRCDEARAADKRLQWQTTAELLGWFDLDLGRANEIVQAHVPTALGRLLGRGDSSEHQRCKEMLAQVLLAQKRSNPILQSAAQALGMLVRPAEVADEDGAFVRALQRFYETGHDRQARYFALISLGRIGGAANRTWLLGAYERGGKSTERPWAAIALGLIGFESAQRGQVDATTAQLLLQDLETIQDGETRAALAVAIGLCGHAAAGSRVLALLGEKEREEILAGYLCVSLALLGHEEAMPHLSSLLDRSLRRPFLLQQAATALGQLGDRIAATSLQKMMEKSESLATLSALANALGKIGDRRSIDPLLGMATDPELTKLARAFVAAALGSIGDKDEMAWSVPLSTDCNYQAAVDTLVNGATGVLDIL